ncbi:hypothetical protein BJ165DRAFT_1402265 [Panaeolus papilionaceus]|nr:hypothetical protein BJ165DRAFT_1402265 [Panaeolus papilionaceus]
MTNSIVIWILYLNLTGTIDVRKVQRGNRWAPNALKILIIGPTGAGKSSFIEALAGPYSSVNNLSSSQLEGYTQHVSVYEVKRIEWRSSPVYLIDTPGFAVEKISSLEIVNQVQRLMNDNSCPLASISTGGPQAV